MDTLKPCWKSLMGGLLLLMASTAQSQIYKWVDERGVVNYSADPPNGRQSQKVDPNAARVTVVPSSPMPTSPGASVSESGLRERVSRLENDLEAERARRTAGQPTEEERLARAREQCLAQRRVDCDTNPYGALPVANEPSVIVQPIVRPIRPIKPITPPPVRQDPPPRAVLEPSRGARLPNE